MDARHVRPNELDALLLGARDRGIELTLSDGRLRFNAPAGAMTDQLRGQLSQRRDEIVAALRGPQPRPQGPVGSAPVLYYYRSMLDQARTGELGVSYTNITNWVVRLSGPFDPRALLAGLRSLVSRYPILGARVALREGVPHFVHSGDVQLCFTDWSNGQGAAGSQGIQAAIDALVWRPFNLDRETLFRPFVFKVAPQKHVIGFVINHFIGDAISVAIVARELFRDYAVALAGSSHSPAAASLQYADYLLEMNRWLLETGLRYRLDYWIRRLQRVRNSCLPPDFSVPVDELGTIQTEVVELAPALVAAARQLADDIGTTVFTVLLAAYYCTLRRALGDSDLVILTVYHGREHPELLKVVGSFQNLIPLRVDAPPDLAFCDLVRQLQADCSAAYERQVAYGYVLDEFRRNGTPHVFPEFNCLANSAVRANSGDGRLEHQPTTPPEFCSAAGQFPYHVVLVCMSDSGWTLKATYLDALYRRETFVKHLNEFARFALLAAQRSQTSVSELARYEGGEVL